MPITERSRYVYVKAPTGHQFTTKEGFMREHRLVMERHLGRVLLSSEHVHHIDGDHANNSIVNLELVSPRDHKRIHFGWLRENGRWIKRPCGGCNRLLPVEDFYEAKKGNVTQCKACCRLRTKQRKEQIKRKRNELCQLHAV